MATMMKAAVLEKVECMKVQEVPVPEINDSEVLIKVKIHRDLRNGLEHLQGLVLRR